MKEIIKKLVIDLDGTLCMQMPSSFLYRCAPPIRRMIDRVNTMYDLGWHITIFTARGMNSYDGDIDKIEKNLGEMTREWLKENGVKYNRLMFGKPPGHLYVDDRCMTPFDFSFNTIEEIVNS
jgi:capsule biosynthesis phosphatase